MTGILRAALLFVALFVVSADAGTPIDDWADSRYKAIERALLANKKSETARCGMQTDKEARLECIASFDLIKRHNDEIIKYDIDRIHKIDKIKNPVLRQKLLDAESAAFSLDNSAVVARIKAIEEIFSKNLAAR